MTPKEKDFVFEKLMKELDIKSIGSTELNRDELIAEAIKKGHKSILSIENDGKIRIVKKKDC